MNLSLQVRWAAARLALVVLLTAAAGAQAQSFTIDRSVIAGGGGTSTNGGFSLTGTLGQPAVGRLSGGQYALDGGFQSIAIAIQTPGAPLLKITRVGNTFLLAWPAVSAGFVLEQTPSLTSRNWQAVASAPVVNGPEFQVVLPALPGTCYYRLRLP